MALDISQFAHIQTEKSLASSVGAGKALYYIVVVDGPVVTYKVTNNDKLLYLGDSSISAAKVFNLADA